MPHPHPPSPPSEVPPLSPRSPPSEVPPLSPPSEAPPSSPPLAAPAQAQAPAVSPPTEASCSLVQPAPAQAPAVPATKTKKRPYTSVEVQEFDDEMMFFDSWVDDDDDDKVFDAKRKFNPKLPGGPAPVDLEEDRSEFRRLTKCATLALEDYNSHRKTNYRFVDIEMATWQPVHGLIYHITFKARNAAEKEYRLFQATVFTNHRMMEVMDVRMKGSRTWYLGSFSELY